ncbi:deoxyguanosinetriphosphate triphosphohydrolase [Allostreptomyces psammosilenae]|uniref:Deoxyguanosinetriphosphate triphosphohydrolase-like protein n=1 Tax=Allostreptomyces psammosilenae TaxID=1892865 RepID=A0A852ZXE7_9ACTN|nr:deoxyguanosinetriphosphate triphosphohydrolase [Allostreptomyces psammosilenae]NYI06695.1 dGTPase [Allostreptomyces psammosilenae]
MAGYTEHDVARWVPEPDKRPGRTAFQRDRARVLHSAALRRLAAKTQVVAPWESDFPRTRLTHSLECAQIGRELGAALGCDPDLVEAACLAHDLGHPPFGHNGEAALDAVAAPCGGFEGNAQSLRLLTRLEPKRFAPADSPIGPRSVGLNLTRAALDAATKYPWPRGGHPTDPASPKYGVYADDIDVFAWVRQPAPASGPAGVPVPGRRCLEAQVMDWADDVAYSVHDFEDGLHAGYLTIEQLHDPTESAALFALAARRQAAPGAVDPTVGAGGAPGGAPTDPEAYAEALRRLAAQEYWPRGHDGAAAGRARLKDAASQLIGRFAIAAEQATRQRHGPGPLTRHGADLVVPPEIRAEVALLKAVADRYVIQRDDQERRRARQRQVIAELADALWRRAPLALDDLHRPLFQEAPDDAARLRAVVDQIASLTDTSALALHRTLVG